MELKDNLIVILKVHDNSKLSQRWVENASYVNLPYKIFIADGGRTNSFDEYINKNTAKSKYLIEFFINKDFIC